jgi:DNA-binding transcriptional regulator GbsR (MarR family)
MSERGAHRSRARRRRPVGGAEPLDRVEARLVRHIGELIRFWGFGRHAGRVWTLLYLQPDPLPAEEIARRLHLSAGSLSQTLGLLERWGAVKRFRAGERRYLLHTQNEDVWGSVVNVLKGREARMIAETNALLAELRDQVARAPAGEKRRRAHLEKRLGSLHRMTRAAELLLSAVAAASSLELPWATRLFDEVRRWRRR